MKKCGKVDVKKSDIEMKKETFAKLYNDINKQFSGFEKL